ncbi:helix-turn-helix transcriptional regulator [Streptomyces sp. NPDC020766]|uniref:helix-turn-helix domain-containing protein n=1 Tax=Streptomyces sp. NPDC020766 TaxID=3155011 RepID=UPI0033CA4A34
MLGRRIAALRESASLSQDQLAERAGIERRSIQRYERAVRDPRFADLLLIAEALDVPLADHVRWALPTPELTRDGTGGSQWRMGACVV